MRPLTLVLVLTLLLGSCSNDAEVSDQGLTQDRLDAVSGLYNLTGHIVSPAQDLNGDGSRSEDLMQELDCLSASIIFRQDKTYSKYYVQLDITFITNDQYAIFCGDNMSSSGTWAFDNNEIILSEEPGNRYSLDGNILTISKNLDLPDFRSQAYLKQ